MILEWVNHADLFRIKGVGEEYADLLEEAGLLSLLVEGGVAAETRQALANQSAVLEAAGFSLRDVVLAMTASTDSNMNRRRLDGLDYAPCASFGLLRTAVEAAEAGTAGAGAVRAAVVAAAG